MKDKHARLLELARRRQGTRWPPHKCIADYHRGQYECDFGSPYTKSASKADAKVMVLLQDWSCDETLSGDSVCGRHRRPRSPSSDQPATPHAVASASRSGARACLCDQRVPVRQARRHERADPSPRSGARRASVRAATNRDHRASACGVPGQGGIRRRGGRDRPPSGPVAGGRDRATVRDRQDAGLVPGAHRTARHQQPKSRRCRPGHAGLGSHGTRISRATGPARPCPPDPGACPFGRPAERAMMRGSNPLARHRHGSGCCCGDVRSTRML